MTLFQRSFPVVIQAEEEWTVMWEGAEAVLELDDVTIIAGYRNSRESDKAWVIGKRGRREPAFYVTLQRRPLAFANHQEGD